MMTRLRMRGSWELRIEYVYESRYPKEDWTVADGHMQRNLGDGGEPGLNSPSSAYRPEPDS